MAEQGRKHSVTCTIELDSPGSSPHSLTQLTPILSTRPPRFLKPRRSSRRPTVNSSVGAHGMRPRFNITTPQFSVTSLSNLSRRPVVEGESSEGGLRRGLFVNTVFSGLIPKERRFCVWSLTGKKKLESVPSISGIRSVFVNSGWQKTYLFQ